MLSGQEWDASARPTSGANVRVSGACPGVIFARTAATRTPRIVPALAQRRERNDEARNAREEVASELAPLHELFEGLMGRCDDAQVHLDGPRRPDGGDLSFLQDTQEGRLRRLRQIRDLVEEQRAAVRRSHEAQLVPHSSGEGALHVPEELALDERRRNRAAIDRDERRGAPAALVERSREHFLAGTRFADQDDGDTGSGQLRGPLEVRREGGIQAHVAWTHLGPEVDVARSPRRHDERRVHPHQHVTGLEDIVVSEDRSLHALAVHERSVGAP